jgi:hypothetical protein
MARTGAYLELDRRKAMPQSPPWPPFRRQAHGLRSPTKVGYFAAIIKVGGHAQLAIEDPPPRRHRSVGSSGSRALIIADLARTVAGLGVLAGRGWPEAARWPALSS